MTPLLWEVSILQHFPKREKFWKQIVFSLLDEILLNQKNLFSPAESEKIYVPIYIL